MIRVVLLPSIEEQVRMGDTRVVDPAAVRVQQDSYTLFDGAGYDVRDVVGRVSGIAFEDGRLMGDVELADRYATEWTRIEKVYSVHVGGLVKTSKMVSVQGIDLLELHLGGKRPAG